MNKRATFRKRCNQNKIFGCGALAELTATYYTIGLNRKRVMASGRCGNVSGQRDTKELAAQWLIDQINADYTAEP